MSADLVAGSVLLPVAAVSLGHVKQLREVPFAALPAVFAAHQLIESLVWGGHEGHVSAGLAHLAAVAYVLIALPLLPTLFPVAVLLIESPGRRRRAVPFVVLGIGVSARLACAIAVHGVTVSVHPHALTYGIGLGDGALWTVLYVLAVIGASLGSGYRTIVAFGVVNLVGLTVVAILYAEAFASLWCVYAAVTSVLVAAHMVLRHRRAATAADRLEVSHSA